MDSSPIPVIRRARGYRLYSERGERLLDLYRDGGGALLGHRVSPATTMMKSVLSRGLLSEVPTSWEKRLAGMIASLFPTHPVVRLFSSRGRALQAVSCCLGLRVGPSDVHDPALHPQPPSAPRAALWRPFLPGPAWPRCTALIPVLPLAICGAPAAVCLAEEPPPDCPDGDHLCGAVLAAALSALARARGETFPVSPIVLEAVDRAPGWRRRGPYVAAVFRPEAYPGVFRDFLRAGVLLSPRYPGPSILPGECSPGEARLLERLFTTIPGG